ncbi:MAG: hypothetical protein H6815_08020 [Phycisphaeraceae bacterium]|nr:hypothetical protein [Phycisphaerales bacterium]MCB9860387.1 hypothetical protein [Phycisphaeraceae bacterium]
MPMKIGLFAYPAMVFMAYLSRPNAVHAFESAGAFSPETSRKPESLNVPMKALRRAVRKRLLVQATNGRYYIDRRMLRRSERQAFVLFAVALLAAVPLFWLMWR